MTDDATLSDFQTGADADDADSTGERRADSSSDDSNTDDSDPAAVTADEEDSAGPPESPGATGLSTYAWGAYTCSRCETETERVWRADGDLVCPDCKSW